MTVAKRRELTTWGIQTYQLSQRQASRLFGISRCALRYKAVDKHDDEVATALQVLAEKYRRWGF